MNKNQYHHRENHSARSCKQFVLPDLSTRNRLAQQQRECLMQKISAERRRRNCKQTAKKGQGHNRPEETYETTTFEVQEIRHWKNDCDHQRHRPRDEENSEFFGKAAIHLGWA